MHLFKTELGVSPSFPPSQSDFSHDLFSFLLYCTITSPNMNMRVNTSQRENGFRCTAGASILPCFRFPIAVSPVHDRASFIGA